MIMLIMIIYIYIYTEVLGAGLVEDDRGLRDGLGCKVGAQSVGATGEDFGNIMHTNFSSIEDFVMASAASSRVKLVCIMLYRKRVYECERVL